jgi:plasmid stabilization system protein ParE
MTTFKIVFSTTAEKELEESFNWYEKKTAGLGERFVVVIDNSLVSICSNPEAYSNKRTKYREFVVDDFPYIIVYELITKDHIINILHVFHTSRNPKLKYKNK